MREGPIPTIFSATPVLLLVLASISISCVAAEDIEQPPMTVAIYQYSETFSSGSLDLVLNGTMYVVCEGIEDLTVNNDSVRSIEFVTSLSGKATGSLETYELFIGYRTHDVSGTFKNYAEEYYDYATGWKLMTVRDRETALYNVDTNPPSSIYFYSEHNVTNYTQLVTDPPDLDSEDIIMSLEPGTNCSIEYWCTCEVDGVRDHSSFEESYSIHQTTNYTCSAIENVTVPLGTYSCRKIIFEEEDTSYVEWRSVDNGLIVKSTSSSEYGAVTISLTEFDDGIEPTVEEEEEDEGLETWMILGAVVPIAAVVLVVSFFVLMKRRKPGQESPPEGGMEVG